MNKNLIKEFENLAKNYSLDDKYREQIISRSREIIKLSKQSIYSLHRNELKQAKKQLSKAEQEILKTNDLINNSSLKEVGSFRACLEEYVEAKGYLFFLENRKIPTREELKSPIPLHYDRYLLGLSDLSGELVRRCVSDATNNNVDNVKEIHTVVEELYGLWLKFDFRGGELRKKFDTLRFNLSKIQTIVYELHMRNV